jgi:hypothetical protein
LVRVRCSAHRPRRSKRRTLLARASPCYLERTAGIEPAYHPVRSRVLIHLSYVHVLGPPAGTDPAPPGRELGILPLDDGGEWLPSQESNPPHVRLAAGRAHLARLMGMRIMKTAGYRASSSATAALATLTEWTTPESVKSFGQPKSKEWKSLARHVQEWNGRARNHRCRKRTIPLLPKRTAFTAQRRHQPVLICTSRIGGNVRC